MQLAHGLNLSRGAIFGASKLGSGEANVTMLGCHKADGVSAVTGASHRFKTQLIVSLNVYLLNFMFVKIL